MKHIGYALLAIGCVAIAGCGGGSSAPQSPVLSVSQTSVAFGASQGVSSNPTPVSVDVTNAGGGSLAFAAASDSPWLTVTPASGTAPQTISVSAAAGVMAVNTYTGHVTITGSSAQGSPATIIVKFVVAPAPSNSAFWPQWGADPQHNGTAAAAAQNAATQLANIVYDPFVAQEQAETAGATGESELTVHYQVPITDGNDVYMMTKSGTYKSCSPAGAWSTAGAACGPNTWSTQIWNEARFTFINGQFTQVWSFASDWKPEPNGSALRGWEPVFHPLDANGFIYVPGAGGTIWKVNQATGSSVSHINPFIGMATVVASNTYVAGPLSADGQGNIYYDVMQLADPTVGDPWQHDVLGAWLVKVTPADATSTLTFASLIPGAPAGTAATCPSQFSGAGTLPWPPSSVIGTTQTPPTVVCGSQRPGLNVAPAIAADGTIFTVSAAHLDGMQAYLVAVKPDFSGAKWVASLQNRLHDGCGVLVPIGPTNATPNACRIGATPGVDPTTNAPGSGTILPQSSSSPTALPDGSVIFGANTSYNGFRGHLFKFDANGNFTGAYDFGWDSTAAAYSHGGTYSIILKDNHYGTGLYCNLSSPICQTLPDGPYYITQLDPNLNIQWQFQDTNTQSCARGPSGAITCTITNPDGFEWCINMPAVDSIGRVYATSEDGNLYVIPQGHTGVFTTPSGNIFLNLALGAAYTPLSIGSDGKIFTQNDGHLFVVGN